MLSIQIDNPELEAELKQTFGSDPQSVVKAFADFVQARRLADDIQISITELGQGQVLKSTDVFNSIRARYEQFTTCFFATRKRAFVTNC